MKPLIVLIAALLLFVSAPVLAADGGSVTNDGVAPVLVVGADIAVQPEVICDAAVTVSPLLGVDVPADRNIVPAVANNDYTISLFAGFSVLKCPCLSGSETGLTSADYLKTRKFDSVKWTR